MEIIWGFFHRVHDYIICYAKNINGITDMGYPVSKEFIEKNFSNPDDDPRGPWTTSDLSANHKGPYFSITNPITGETFFHRKVDIGCLMHKRFRNELLMEELFLGKVAQLDRCKKFLLLIENS